MTPETESTNIESATIERGESLFCDEKYREALDVFLAIVDADPTNSAALNNAGITFGALGDIESSFDYLHEALQADRSCAPAFFNLIDLAVSCEAIEAGRKIFMLFHQGIEECNEKIAFEDMLFSPEAQGLIEQRGREAATERQEDSRIKNRHLINRQTQRLAGSAA